MASLRRAALLLAALCLSAQSACAQYELTLSTASQQTVGPSYRLFAGATDTLTVTHSAPVGVGDGTILTLSCATDTPAGAGFTVTPATQCLGATSVSTSVSFKITAGAKAVGAATNSPVCTFALSGFNVSAFGSVPALGALAIRAPQSLTVPKLLQRATDFNNPLQVFVANYPYVYIAGNEEAAAGTVQLVPTCTLAASTSSSALDPVSLHLNFSITFSYAGYVHCTLEFINGNKSDDGRYGFPASLYFQVLPVARTLLTIDGDNLQFSATQNTTNYLAITPTPLLTEDEYLEVTMTGCTGQGGELSADVDPVLAQSTARFGFGASAWQTLAVRVPTFAYGGVHATCDVSMVGTPSAMLRYALSASDPVTATSVDVRAGQRVQLTAELDLVTEPLGMFNPVVGAEIAVRVLLPQGVAVTLGQNLVITVSCNAACTAYTGAVSPSTNSESQLAGDWIRNSTGDMTNSPLFMFTADMLGSVECTWELGGDDERYYVAPANTYFTIRPKQELSISADSGLNSPITSLNTTGYTQSALDLGTNPTLTVTVNAPQRNLNVSLSCEMSGVLNMSVSGADSSSTPDYTFGLLSFVSSGLTAGRFMIAPVIDTTRLNGGIKCTFSLSGQAAILYATPAPLNFYIGKVTELSATLLPAAFNAALVWYPDAARNDATRARINVTAKDRSALVGMGGVRLDYTCTDDLLVLAIATPSSLSFPVGEFGYGAPFTVIPYTSSTAREKNTRANIGVTCVFRLDQLYQAAGDMDVRAYRVPDPLSLTFVPKPYIAVSGSAVQNNPVPSASSQTLDFTLSSMPTSGELVSLNITCPGFVEIDSFVQWTSLSASTQSTAWTMPTVASGLGNTVQCSFVLVSDNGKYRMQSADSFVWITVGALRTWSQSPATIPTVWPNQITDSITLQPSGCLADATITADCYNDADLVNTAGSITITSNNPMTDATQNLVFTFQAPGTYKYSWTRCTFTRTWDAAWTKVAVEEIPPIVFQLGQKAAMQIDGMSDGRTPFELVTLSVRPTATVGSTGLTVKVECFYTGDTSSNVAISIYNGPNTFYWFAGTSMSQSFQIQLPFISGPDIYTWYCTAVVQDDLANDSAKLAEGDRTHFSDFLSEDSNGKRITYQVGSPYRFSLSTSGIPFIQRTCAAGGSTSVTVSIPGDAPTSTLRVSCLLTRADGGGTTSLTLTTPNGPGGNPMTFTTITMVSNRISCAADRTTSFTVNAGDDELDTGDITCTYESTLAVSQLAPAKQKMYAGTTNPYAVSESDNKLSGGAIAGIVIGVIAFVAIVAVVLVLVLKGGAAASPAVQQKPAVAMV